MVNMFRLFTLGKRHDSSLMVLEKSKVFPDFWGELFWLSAIKYLRQKKYVIVSGRNGILFFPFFLENLGRQFKHLLFKQHFEIPKMAYLMSSLGKTG